MSECRLIGSVRPSVRSKVTSGGVCVFKISMYECVHMYVYVYSVRKLSQGGQYVRLECTERTGQWQTKNNSLYIIYIMSNINIAITDKTRQVYGQALSSPVNYSSDDCTVCPRDSTMLCSTASSLNIPSPLLPLRLQCSPTNPPSPSPSIPLHLASERGRKCKLDLTQRLSLYPHGLYLS